MNPSPTIINKPGAEGGEAAVQTPVPSGEKIAAPTDIPMESPASNNDENVEQATSTNGTCLPPSSNPSSSNSPSVPMISQAAAAGIGIGSAVGSALIVLVVVFLWANLKKRKIKDEQGALGTSDIPRPDAGRPQYRRDIDHGYNSIVDFLPEPVAHSELSDEFNSLLADIKNCVDNYFPHERVALSADAERSLQALAGRPDGSQTWSGLLTKRNLRPLIIRSLMARILLSWIDPRSESQLTLLSSDLRGVYQHLLAETPTEGRKAAKRPDLLSLWRRISCHLILSRQILDKERLGSLSVELASALEPLRPKQRGNYSAMLQGLVEDTARLGMTLLAQPEDWKAVWTGSHLHGETKVCVFPAVYFVRRESRRDHGRDGAQMIPLFEAVIET